jgi:uncharacterized protein (TIGR02246 family)
MEHAQQLSEEVLAEQLEFEQRLVEAMRNKDLEGIMSCFYDSPDLIVVGWDGNVQHGADEVRGIMQQWFADAEAIDLEINEITRVPAGDDVIAAGIATYHIHPTEGPPTQLREVWTDLRRKIDGRWVCVLDHVQVLPPVGA